MSDAGIIESTFIVVGGGIAGVSCIERLSSLCTEESILLLTASNVVKTVTNLSQLTKLLSTFDVVEKLVDDYADENSRIRVMPAFVLSVDSLKREVLTSDGRRFRYKYLCLCHGARPKVIGEPSQYILGIRDTESVETFQERLKGSRRIAIVGNGGIATELVHELQGVDIVWAIKDDSVSATFVDPGAGQFFLDELSRVKDKSEVEEQLFKQRPKYVVKNFSKTEEKSPVNVLGGALGPDWHEGIHIKGVAGQKLVKVEFKVEVKRVWKREDLFKDDSVKKMVLKCAEDLGPIKQAENELGWNIFIELTNGKIFGVDFVVSATGVIPNGNLIKIVGEKELKLSPEGAILVNQQMETSLPGIYAAGDVCQADWGSHSKHWFQMRLWTQARQMGLFVAHCLFTEMETSGKDKQVLDFCFEMFTHVTKFFGFKVILLGLYNGQGLGSDFEILLRTTKGKEYIKVIMQHGRMQGAVLIGDTDLEETFENLILNQMDLSDFGVDLLDPDIDIEDFFD